MPNEPKSALHLIIVEDSDLDYELALAHLVDDASLDVASVTAQRVEDDPGLRTALSAGHVDAVITDHNLPRFDSFSALRVAREFDADLPVLVLSGEMSDELAVAALHAGADDFLLKSRMLRLAPALKRALEAATIRRERRAQEQRLRELTAHLERVREEERHALARELHDEVGALLTALKFELSHLARELYGRPAVAPHVRAMQELLTQAVAASHRIQYNLRPPVLDAGLPAALDWMARGFSERTGVTTRYESNRDALELAPAKAAALYRFAQESLNNVARHAQAGSVQVTLFATDAEVTLEVADDGIGFDPDMLDSAPGFGLRGLVERASSLGGWAEINSVPGRGTTVMLSVPVAADGAAAAAATIHYPLNDTD
jgi:signal transduction histidine kinase